jgi:hypothetical protein
VSARNRPPSDSDLTAITTRRLSGIQENVGVPDDGGIVCSKMRRGGLLASAGYGISHASSPRFALRNSSNCAPSGENRTVGVL